MVQVIVSARADLSDEVKQKIATGLTEVISSAVGGASEVSVWFQAFSASDVFVASEAGRE